MAYSDLTDSHLDAIVQQVRNYLASTNGDDGNRIGRIVIPSANLSIMILTGSHAVPATMVLHATYATLDAALRANDRHHAIQLVHVGARWARSRWARRQATRPAPEPLLAEPAAAVAEPGCGEALLAAIDRLTPAPRRALRSRWEGARLATVRERVAASVGVKQLRQDARLRREVLP